MKQIMEDALMGEIYFTNEDVVNILINKDVYTADMDKYIPDFITNVDNALNTITQLVDKHIIHKLNSKPYTWNNLDLLIQVDSIQDLCNANFPAGQIAAVAVNNKVKINISCDKERRQVDCTITVTPLGTMFKTSVFSFTYEDDESLRSELITYLYKMYNTTFMCDFDKEVSLCYNLHSGYYSGKNIGDNCFMLSEPLKSMLNISTPELKAYVIERIKSIINKYEPIVTEVNPTVKYADDKAYLEYR